MAGFCLLDPKIFILRKLVDHWLKKMHLEGSNKPKLQGGKDNVSRLGLELEGKFYTLVNKWEKSQPIFHSLVYWLNAFFIWECVPVFSWSSVTPCWCPESWLSLPLACCPHNAHALDAFLLSCLPRLTFSDLYMLVPLDVPPLLMLAPLLGTSFSPHSVSPSPSETTHILYAAQLTRPLFPLHAFPKARIRPPWEW